MPITVPIRRSTSRTLVGVAGLCALALTATMVPATTASASRGDDQRAVELLGPAGTGRQADAESRAAADERSRPVDVDAAALDDVRAGDRISLTVFDDTTITAAVGDRTSADGVTSWTGSLVGTTGTFTAVEVDGVVRMQVASAADGTFEVSSVPGGGYEVTEVPSPSDAHDDAVRPAEQAAIHADHAHAKVPAGRGGDVPVAADEPSTVDVAIVYSASLPASAGGEAAMQAQFALGITQTNQAFAASGIGTQLRLVGTRQVAAAPYSSLDANYRALGTPGDGVFDEAQALREETHADLVSLWLGGPYPAGSYCGLGSLGGTSPAYDPERAAWTVVWADKCATANLTFAHEIGHNLSADHDPGASSPPIGGGKPYARGYVDVPGNFRTVMSYPTTCQGCAAVTHFSNPNVAYGGRTTGAAAANNAQAINEQIAAVANYRQSQIYPGVTTVGGSPRFKGMATATTTPWSPTVTLGYQWLLDGVAVPGATTSTFSLSRRDIGKSLSVQVVGSAPFYPSVATVSAPVVVGKASFRTKRPKLRGVPRAGRVLSVKVKGWKPKPAKKNVKVRYQWLRNGKAIKGAKKAAYRVRAKDRGKKISVQVTAKAKGYEKARRSSKKVKIRR
ncbi:reprolysin-like metallopeptidase [Nocardioides sp. zg-1228]|uniref:reprolysin-like metallopeptidase n=1 Tax=Nocardioides sp. zg-1228 TaxID=2763008 RepID=UPI001642D32F|nr:M12 family metallo-peptidase [Nocardioides sp. zg-1228]MBC2931781.1 hypothetical protein [Nocardioides sp. zg-1228]QSF57359.1 hypothetical protein JX575_17715 [Nocardioides sp. zg-1228]